MDYRNQSWEQKNSMFLNIIVFLLGILLKIFSWDNVYEREVSNFTEFNDEGEVWFGEEAEERIVQWLEDHIQTSFREVSEAAPFRVLDLGTGNGHLLFRLLEEEDTLLPSPCQLVGVDYSEAAIVLAKNIARHRQFSDKVKFQQLDIIKDSKFCSKDWDLILDKGTFDAISLSGELLDGRPLNSVYVDRVRGMLSPNGIFLITSCNWTIQELEERFTKNGFIVHSTVPVPVFEFQGSTGSSTSVIAFQIDPSFNRK